MAADSLFLTLNERHNSENPTAPLFPLIQGVLAFDTPYNGLSRSMFVYGAFSNYQKVSSVFNVMTALSAGPAALGKLAFGRGSKKMAASAASAGAAGAPAWKAWQLIAVKTGTVGAIAAGGVAAYIHRKKIMEGMRSVRNLNKQSVIEGYQSSVDALGQGLAYINRDNVGQSFAWLSAHFTFVGSLLKQTELNRRLERMTSLQGIGLHDFYASLGENGYWSGGYFVPERTFCAVPQEDQPSSKLFERRVLKSVQDEIQAHMSMFVPEKNLDYEEMTDEAAKLAVKWFTADDEVVDDPKFAKEAVELTPEEEAIKMTEDGVEVDTDKLPEAEEAAQCAADSLPDESPIDIAAAASLVPLPDDDVPIEELPADEQQKATYMRHLFGVAQQAGTGLKRMSEWSSQLPAKMPKLDGISKPSMPTMPTLPSMPKPSMPAMPGMPNMPSFFSRKQQTSSLTDESNEAGGKEDEPAVDEMKEGAAEDSTPATLGGTGTQDKAEEATRKE